MSVIHEIADQLALDSDDREPCRCDAMVCQQKKYQGSHLGTRTYCKYSRQTRLMLFARQHDWGNEAIANEDGSTVCTAVLLENGQWSTESRTFSKMDELRAWAGY